MDNIIENIELIYTPNTKQLLITYCKIQYEENADLSDESLQLELIWLYQNNKLDELFLAEYLASEARLITDFYIDDEKSIFKPLVKDQLINLIKSKFEGVKGVEYNGMLKDFHLIKDNNGKFEIEVPTK